MILKGYLFTYGYLIVILLLAFGLRKIFNLRTLFTKKFIHIMISFCYLILYKYFGSSIHIIIPPLSFIVINILSYKFKLFKSMEDGSGNLGTIYYPISVFIMALVTYFVPDFYGAFGVAFILFIRSCLTNHFLYVQVAFAWLGPVWRRATVGYRCPDGTFPKHRVSGFQRRGFACR